MKSLRLPLYGVVLALCACQPAPPAASASVDNTGKPTQVSAAPAKPDAQAAPAETARNETPTLKIATVDGGVYDLATKRGRWVVVNFWATWCAPCLKEMPDLDAFDAAREDVDVLGLAYEEIAIDEMRAFLAKRPVKYPIAIVDTYNPPSDFATPRGLPMTYVIAPDGRVVEEFMGPVTRADLSAVIDGAPAAKAATDTTAADKASASG